MSTVQIRPIGLVIKNHQPGHWRLIVDLSSPWLAIFKEGIATELCSLSNICFDEAAQRLFQHNPGALIAKLDMESVYCIIPVHPEDCYLLGVRSNGAVYFDRALPFRSSVGVKDIPVLGRLCSLNYVSQRGHRP